MTYNTLPEGLPALQEARQRLPRPELVPVRPGLRLETLHLPGPPPALVFIHGGLGNLWNPYPQLLYFHGKRELVSYSLAGNGRSDDGERHTLEGHVADLADLLETLGVGEAVPVGWSYGTALALEYAKAHPVRGLMLTGGGACGLTPGWERVALRLILALRLYRVLPREAFLKRLGQEAAFHPETPDAVVDEMIRANPLPRRRSAWQTVTDAFWGYDGRPGLEAITAPALVVHGTADGIVPLERAQETARLLPNGEFCELERAGHTAPVERPRVYNWLLEALVEAIAAPDRWPENVRSLTGLGLSAV